MSETGPQDQPDEALVDLLIKQVTEGLSPAEQRALDVLDSEAVSANLRELERAAAAITLAGCAADAEPLQKIGDAAALPLQIAIGQFGNGVGIGELVGPALVDIAVEQIGHCIVSA